MVWVGEFSFSSSNVSFAVFLVYFGGTFYFKKLESSSPCLQIHSIKNQLNKYWLNLDAFIVFQSQKFILTWLTGKKQNVKNHLTEATVLFIHHTLKSDKTTNYPQSPVCFHERFSPRLVERILCSNNTVAVNRVKFMMGKLHGRSQGGAIPLTIFIDVKWKVICEHESLRLIFSYVFVQYCFISVHHFRPFTG